MPSLKVNSYFSVYLNQVQRMWERIPSHFQQLGFLEYLAGNKRFICFQPLCIIRQRERNLKVISKYKLHLVIAVFLAIGLAVLATSPTYAQTTSPHSATHPSSIANPSLAHILLDGYCAGRAQTCGGGCQNTGSLRVCISVNKSDLVIADAYVISGTVCQVGIQMYVNNSLNLGTPFYANCYSSGTFFSGFSVPDIHNDGYNVWHSQACGSATPNGNRFCAESPYQYT
jgi:hypothetical protein